MDLSLFESRRSPYYILASDFRHSSAGIRNLHYLCHTLNETGYEAYLAGVNVTSDFLRTPLLDEATVERHFRSGRTPIAVYAEVTAGNPLQIPVVARWLLNVPGVLCGDVFFRKDELIFYHLPWCLPEGQEGHPLYVPSTDTRLFNNENNPLDSKRSGFCRYAKKYLEFGGKIKPEHESYQSLGHEVPLTPEDIASILRRSEALYCYERSAIIQEAIACGCPVLTVASEYWDIQPYEVSEPGIEIDTGPASLAKAKAEIGNSAQMLRDNQNQALWQIQQFAELTQGQAQKILSVASRPASFDSLLDFWLLGADERMQHFGEFRKIRARLSTTTNVNEIKPTDRESEYTKWSLKHQAQEADLPYFQEHVGKLWTKQPLFEIILVLRSGQETLLADTIDSLTMQFYEGWQLSIFAQTPSPDPEFSAESSKLRWFQVECENDVADTINRRVLHSMAAWFGFFECGTQFPQQALLVCGDYIATRPDWRLIYSDDDEIDAEGLRRSPRFKPDFNPDLLRSTDYIGSFFVEKNALVSAGGFTHHPGGERYDLTLRILDSQSEASIGHIPDVLCHIPHSVVREADNEAAIRSLQAHFDRRLVRAEIEPGLVSGQTRRIVYRHEAQPRVTIIIPTRNGLDLLGECIGNLLSHTHYPNWELLIVDNGSDDPDVSVYYQALLASLRGRIRIVEFPGDFNFAAINNLAAREASGDYLLLLNNDTLAQHDDWLDVMMNHAQRPEIGIVGARLLAADDQSLQHAGLVLGMRGTAGSAFKEQALDDPGDMLRAQVEQNYSAVSGACLLVRKSLYLEVGGMDENDFRISDGDVDLCLKIRKLGYRILWTPHATLLHHGSATLALANEETQKQYASLRQHAAHQLCKRWQPELANDPAWSRNLSLSRSDSVAESELVPAWNPDFHDRPRLLWMPLGNPGQAEYRTFAPMRALHEEGLAQCAAVCQPRPGQPDRAPTPIELARLAPDTLILHAPVDNVRGIALQHYKEINSDILRIFSLDDLITNIPTGSHVHHKLPSAAMKDRLHLGLAACDRLIVSTEPLAEICRDMIGDIRLVPNTLEWKIWGVLQSARRRGAKPRVGWAGAQQHAGDLQFTLDVIKATYTEVDWVFFGMMPYGAQSYVAEFHDFVPRFSDYPAKLASLDLDLAVAPLEIHPFNEAKSNLRLLEYSILGWPVICTDIHPYRTDNPPVTRLPNDAGKWIAAIRERIAEPDALAREGDALREWVKQHYLLENNLERWLRALT